MGIVSFSKIFLIFSFAILFSLIFALKGFSDYGLTDALNVTLNSPSDNSFINTKDVDFTFNVEWDDSIIITNCTLFGNFTGEWVASETNQTEIVEGENGIYLEDLEDGAYEWNVYCYNETDVYDLAESNFTLTIDTEAPTYSLSSTNSTIAGSEIEHSMLWKDNVELDYAIFSLDNCTGEFENITEISLSEPEAWSNFTVRVNETVGCEIKWKIYANDSAGNWNESETYSYITTYNPYLTGCSVLDQEGATYYLSSDIEDSSAIGCINITRKNIILDCKNHVIDGVFEFETVGIVVNYTDDDANTNVTIKNCNVKDWFIGIVLLGENNVVINSTLNFNNVSGILIQNGHYNKIINVTSNNNTYTGIFISDNSSHNTIIKSVTNGNNVTGICINNGSTYNTILSSISNENNQSSILIYDAHNNQIIDSNFEDNYYGIWILNSTNNSLISSNSSSEFLSLYLFNSTNNTIAKSTFKSNVVGIILYKSSKNTFINNLIEENLFGVYLEECTECDEYTVDNLFYNNLFKNEINVEFCNFNSTLDCTETFSKNFWNTTKQPGTRIYSPGDQIGGNYWTNLDDNGYSDTCSDNNKDGFCDLPHVLDPDLAGNNIDYYALSDEYGVPSPPSPRSGGGGGPGAPQTTVTTTPGKAIISIPLIAAMSKANVSIQKTEGVDFTQIVISVRNRVTSVQINITKLDAKPEEVPALVNVYRYIRVDKKNIHDENITEVKLRFRVRKSWINSNNIRVDSITLYRFTYTWEKLNTLKIGEDSEDIYFEASSPGLSYFAIAGEKSKQNCTYECCVGEEEYYDKPCTSGYKCENHVCVPITVPCTEDWVCTEWSECIEGKQTRVCTDKNKCGTVANKPEEERACEEKLPTLVFWLGIVIVLLFIFLVAKMVVKKVKPKEKPKLKEKR